MKKLLFLLLMLVPLVSNAQYKWEVDYEPADELKGTKADSVYFYLCDSVGSFTYRYNSHDTFVLYSTKGSFKCRYNGWSLPKNAIQTNATIGLYDDNGELKDKFEYALNVGNDFNIAFSRLQYKKYARKVISWLESGKGYVRIVAALRNGLDFDLVVPHR